MAEFDPSQAVSDLISGSFTGQNGDYAVILFVFGVLIAIIIGAAVFSGYIRLILNIADFAHPVARVRAIGNPLVEKDTLETLAGSLSAEEITENLRKFGYGLSSHRVMNEEESGMYFRREYYLSLEKLLDTVPKSVRPFFEAYMKFAEAGEIKYMLRALRGGISPKTVPVGMFTDRINRRISSTKTESDIRSILYSLDLIPEEYDMEDETLQSAELVIDRHLCDSLAFASAQVDVSLAEPLALFTGHLIDVQNLKNLCRAVSLGLDSGHKAMLMTEGGFEFHGDSLKSLSMSRTKEELKEACRSTVYRDAMENAFREGASPEKELEKMLLEVSDNLSSRYHLGSGPLIRYAYARRIEYENLTATYTGVTERMAPEDIMGMMVFSEET
ncbi:vacuolar-type H+-ATPase subunit C/Vma6 [Methanomicrobium sp. W14]|uniref:V-type ATPase subunit n=1 Tax=Methanomicrobium sp. W14 TaxID=2817839 RepID=UPI001AE8A394|nr:V-type ATPase subunit [Methanomicrobium sp. W14]MBP2133326.1 vacuolar-type H+-ATPase subunit C/Vma6 [Methanomicrobium sp. W14]